MRILALDASGAGCSAALLDGGICLAERSGGDSRTATACLPALVRGLLDEFGGGFGAVAVTVGPGSFTGLRGALALAHGLAMGSGVPVVGVTVPEAVRHGADAASAWVALDARRAGRVFLDRCGVAEAFTLDALPLPDGPVQILGDAAGPVTALLRAGGARAMQGEYGAVSAFDVGQVALQRLAGTIGPCAPQPLYVEPPAVR